MSEEIHWEEIVAKAFRNEALSAKEAAWWEENRDSQRVRDELQFLEHLQEPLRVENRKLLKDQLQKIETKSPKARSSSSPVKTRNLGAKYWRYAAGLLLLITAGILLWPNQNQNYLTEYLEPYPNIVNPVLKGDASSRDAIEQGMSAYENQEYESAIAYLQQVNAPSDTIRFYQANAYLSLNQPEQALEQFEDLVISSPRFGRESAWFQVLCLLSLDRREEAASILQSIANRSDHPYNQEARDLLERIR